MSAGRVQSPALRILVEREREIINFIPVPYFVLIGNFIFNEDEQYGGNPDGVKEKPRGAKSEAQKR